MAKKNQTTFAYPVEKICGKISRHSKVVHACTASGKQTTYLQGERDLNAHPVTSAELARRDLFKRRQAAASVRLDHESSTYAADMAAYRAQYDKGIQSFPKYIWSKVMEEIGE